MISRNDVLLLLSELKDSGIDTQAAEKELILSPAVPISVLEFVNEHRSLDLVNFYEKLRKSYNHKKSKLYKQIVSDDIKASQIVTTLSSLCLQILLFSDSVEDREMFLRHARAREISLALSKYFTTYDLTICQKLLRLIKADLCSCEYVNKRREIDMISV